jgi:hypothetical protein
MRALIEALASAGLVLLYDSTTGQLLIVSREETPDDEGL